MRLNGFNYDRRDYKRRKDMRLQKISFTKGKFPMQWGLQVLPDVVIVRIFGLPDHSLGGMFEKAAERAMNLDNRKVLVDFSNVECMDPMGLMLCAYGLYHLRQLGIPIALIQPPVSLFPVLHRHGMQEPPPVFSHEYDARTMN
jgi:anti-anti-sigma regulatory factor